LKHERKSVRDVKSPAIFFTDVVALYERMLEAAITEHGGMKEPTYKSEARHANHG
jgi:hypothetical protein